MADYRERDRAPRTRGKMPRPPREDGRDQFLLYLNPELIKRLKNEAISKDVFVYQLAEEMLLKAMDALDQKDPDRHAHIYERSRHNVTPLDD